MNDMAYKFIIHTDSYRQVPNISENDKVLNYVMEKMNGLWYKEGSYRQLEYRLHFFLEGSIYPFSPHFSGPKSIFYWLDKHKKKNYIDISHLVDKDKVSPQYPVSLPSYPYKATELYSINWVKDALSKDGVCKIPFKVFYADEVGYFENFDGCYVEIIKC